MRDHEFQDDIYRAERLALSLTHPDDIATLMKYAAELRARLQRPAAESLGVAKEDRL